MNKNTLLTILLLFLLIPGASTPSYAEVYDFDFENTETPQPVTSASPPSASQQQKPVMKTTTMKWRLNLAYSIYQQRNPFYRGGMKDCNVAEDDQLTPSCSLYQDISGRGVNVGINYFLNRRLNLQTYFILAKIGSVPRVLRLMGVELQQFMIMRLPGKAFHREFSGGLLGGLNNMGLTYSGTKNIEEQRTLGYFSKNGIRVHLGAHLSLTVFEDVNALLSVRKSFGRDEFLQFDIGMGFLF